MVGLMVETPEVLDTLVEEIACKHEDVHRCAVTTLANLAKNRGLRCVLSDCVF